MANKKLLCIFVVLISITANAQESVLGKWITIDDETGIKKSVIELFMKGNRLHGRVDELYLTPEEGENPLCIECEGELNGEPVRGMEILTKMAYDAEDKEWAEGEILDPENGTTYDCKLWLEDGKLFVRGYVAFFYRTQTWERLKTN
jgi:uncharacterized protein (DUF2147 family)